MKALPGVDLVQTGLQQSSVVSRGFNNVFSGSLLVLADNRYARVPSLRFNAYNLIPTTNMDMERIEVLLGPGAALYGPNSAKGVMHIITTSPIDDPGTRISLAGGERSVFHGTFRHASRVSEQWGFKISGQYFRGDDWEFIDPREVFERQVDSIGNPTNRNLRIANRDFGAGRWSGETRLDFRPSDDAELIFSGGVNTLLSSIELTDVGAVQADDWRYSYFQTRFRTGRLFAQLFLNTSNAGDTYFLRTGNSIVDKSRMFVAQIQHGFDVGERQNFIYGLDLQRTEPRTDSTIMGRNEDDDEINEAGVYLHSETSLSDRLDLVGAVRLDYHDHLEDLNFSPRVALVFRPAEGQNFRITFNRAFSTPTTTNLFLDLKAGSIGIAPGIGYDIQTRGVPEDGFTFNDRCPGGFQDLCMRSPFAPGQLPANAALAWNALIRAFAPAALQPFLVSDNPPVQTILRRLDFAEAQKAEPDPAKLFPLDPIGPQDIDPIRSTITSTFELGYKGLIADRLLLAADVYRNSIKDFVGPLKVATSTVFLDPLFTAAFIQERLTPVVPPQELANTVQALTEGLAGVPIGNVAPDQSTVPDFITTFRNFGDVDLWGADLAAQLLVSAELSLKGTFSWVSEECFDLNEDGDCSDGVDIALNAPTTKGSFTAHYGNAAAGFTAEGRVRFVGDFPTNSGVYVGDMEGYTVVDANLGYRLPMVPGATITLTVTNLLNEVHREFIGAPEMGRLVLARLSLQL